CNRNDALTRSPDRRGLTCSGRWSTDLNIAKVFPRVGRWLLASALREWPIRLAPLDASTSTLPVVSFIVGHRGQERIPHLLATLRSRLAQEDVPIECLVVEQAGESVLHGLLPPSIRHVFTPPPYPDLPYSRSWAFNVGARQARGEVLIFHDNDLLAPVA